MALVGGRGLTLVSLGTKCAIENRLLQPSECGLVDSQTPSSLPCLSTNDADLLGVAPAPPAYQQVETDPESFQSSQVLQFVTGYNPGYFFAVKHRLVPQYLLLQDTHEGDSELYGGVLQG